MLIEKYFYKKAWRVPLEGCTFAFLLCEKKYFSKNFSKSFGSNKKGFTFAAAFKGKWLRNKEAADFCKRGSCEKIFETRGEEVRKKLR
ncbi:MAG: hypothetical protein EA409_11570 [Saprospirales bacterium]|nr:MAG: hypothetical protein EA409_11570 [Saprospirales bacterium]